MANYCISSDIKVALGYPNDYSSSSRPTLAEVNTIITDITNEIDLYLRSVGISSQPTDANILGRLSKACIYGSAADVGFGFLNQSQSVDGTLAHYYKEKYQAILDEIKKKPEIYGLVVDAESLYASNQVLDNTYSEDEINDNYLSSDFEF
jgi:hypothetical protein